MISANYVRLISVFLFLFALTSVTYSTDLCKTGVGISILNQYNPSGDYFVPIVDSTEIHPKCQLQVGQTINFFVDTGKTDGMFQFASLTYSGRNSEKWNDWFEGKYDLEYTENISSQTTINKVAVEEKAFTIDSQNTQVVINGVFDSGWGDTVVVDSLNLTLKRGAVAYLLSKATMVRRNLEGQSINSEIDRQVQANISRISVPFEVRNKINLFLNEFSLTKELITFGDNEANINPIDPMRFDGLVTEIKTLDDWAYVGPVFNLLIDGEVYDSASGTNFTKINIFRAINSLAYRNKPYEISITVTDSRNNIHKSKIWYLTVLEKGKLQLNKLNEFRDQIFLSKDNIVEGETVILYPLQLGQDLDEALVSAMVQSSDVSYSSKSFSKTSWSSIKKQVETELGSLKPGLYELKFSISLKDNEKFNLNKTLSFTVNKKGELYSYIKIPFNSQFISKIKSGLDSIDYSLPEQIEFKRINPKTYIERYLKIYEIEFLPNNNYRKSGGPVNFTTLVFDEKSNELFLNYDKSWLNKIILFELDDGANKGLTNWNGVFKVEEGDLVSEGINK